MHRMKLLTLDWEGTLVDFQWALDDAVAETTALMHKCKVPASFEGMDYAALYNEVVEMEEKWGYEKGALLHLVDEIYDRYDLDAASRWALCEEFETTIKALQKYQLALVSNVGRKGLEKMFKLHGLKNAFGFVLTRNDMPGLKPHPGGIFAAMSWAGAQKEETLHIGDSLSDLYAARNAGVRIAVVLGGQHSADTLLPQKPDLVLEKLKELPLKLEEL